MIRPSKIRTPITPSEPHKAIKLKTADGYQLAGWWIPGGGTATIIIGHGYPFDKGNIYQATRWLHPKFNLLYYDHRSFGESTGSYTTGGIKETKDVEAAIKYAKQKSDGPIGLYGFSLSAAAMLMSDHQDISAIVADSSYATPEDLLQHVYSPFGPLGLPLAWLSGLYGRILVGRRKTPLDSIQNIKTPLYIIHSRDDTQIPVKAAYRLREKAQPEATVAIIKGVDHGGSLALPNIRNRVIDFFESHLIEE